MQTSPPPQHPTVAGGALFRARPSSAGLVKRTRALAPGARTPPHCSNSPSVAHCLRTRLQAEEIGVFVIHRK